MKIFCFIFDKLSDPKIVIILYGLMIISIFVHIMFLNERLNYLENYIDILEKGGKK